jgi:hypothetical protein
MVDLEKNSKGRTVMNYLLNPLIFEKSVVPFDKPMNRKNLPPKIKTPWGSIIKFDQKNLTKQPTNKNNILIPGNQVRFNYTSSFGDNREHDTKPWIIILAKDATNKIFNISETVRARDKNGNDKFPSVYGKEYFYGLNLNYFKFDFASLIVEAVNIQKIFGDFVTYGTLKDLLTDIPEYCFRMYYRDWCAGFKKVTPSRESKDGEQQKKQEE